MVVAMYHDQGHIALKTIGFDRAVNITLGLPIVRTSVAHGTAYDIAWKGRAETSSLIESVRVAARMVSVVASSACPSARRDGRSASTLSERDKAVEGVIGRSRMSSGRMIEMGGDLRTIEAGQGFHGRGHWIVGAVDLLGGLLVPVFQRTRCGPGLGDHWKPESTVVGSSRRRLC